MLSFSFFLCALLFLVLPAEALLGNKWEATSFCKCVCFGANYSILHMDIPDDPSKPCLSCTKQWCLNQNLPVCAGASLGDTDPDTATGKEGDVEARCFQRDSPRDQLVVTLFLLTVFGLLLGAGIKGRMQKAGIDTSLSWSTGRKWWQALGHFSDTPTSNRNPDGEGGARSLWEAGSGDYVAISNAAPDR